MVAWQITTLKFIQSRGFVFASKVQVHD